MHATNGFSVIDNPAELRSVSLFILKTLSTLRPFFWWYQIVVFTVIFQSRLLLGSIPETYL